MIPYVYSNMKKFTLILAALITSTLLTGCNTTPEKKHHREHKKQHHQRNLGREFIRGNYNGDRMRGNVSPEFLLKRKERMEKRRSRRPETPKKVRKGVGKA